MKVENYVCNFCGKGIEIYFKREVSGAISRDDIAWDGVPCDRKGRKANGTSMRMSVFHICKGCLDKLEHPVVDEEQEQPVEEEEQESPRDDGWRADSWGDDFDDDDEESADE